MNHQKWIKLNPTTLVHLKKFNMQTWCVIFNTQVFQVEMHDCRFEDVLWKPTLWSMNFHLDLCSHKLIIQTHVTNPVLQCITLRYLSIIVNHKSFDVKPPAARQPVQWLPSLRRSLAFYTSQQVQTTLFKTSLPTIHFPGLCKFQGGYVVDFSSRPTWGAI